LETHLAQAAHKTPSLVEEEDEMSLPGEEEEDWSDLSKLLGAFVWGAVYCLLFDK